MSHTLNSVRRGLRGPASPGIVPLAPLDADAVRAAYRRWAGVYDFIFGGVSAIARRRAIELLNSLPGTQILEVGVGTGLALPHYRRQKLVTGVDLSAEMLSRARQRVETLRLSNIGPLLEMDAEAMDFPDASFDVAVAMFVASVVPNPRRVLSEMRRVVRPGGRLLFVNHFAAEKGARWWVERALAPASHALGWHPDFAMDALFSAEDRAELVFEPSPPFGIFTLAQLPN